MPYTVLHVRWSEVAPDACEKARAALDANGPAAEGCLARDLRRYGTALLDTEVWADGESLRRFAGRLPEIVAPAGLGRPSHVASYVLPDALSAAYLRPGRGPGFLAHPLAPADGGPIAVPPIAVPPGAEPPAAGAQAAGSTAAPQFPVAAVVPRPWTAERQRAGVW